MLWLLIMAPLLGSPGYEPVLIPVCPPEIWGNRESWQPITSYLDTACTSKPEAYKAIIKVWRDGLNSWEESSHSKVSDTKEWCGDYIRRGEDSIKTLMQGLDSYLATEEKFISDFMVSGHKHTMEHLCKDGEDALREQVNINDNEQCETDIAITAEHAMINCLPEAPFYQGMKDIDAVINKSHFCSNFRSTTKCITDYVEAHCTGRDFSSFLNTIFEKHLDWCNKNNI